MVLEINRVGDSNWPRYVLVARSPQDAQFWNGAAWVSDLSAARLYAFLPEVCREFEKLEARRHDENFVQEYEAKVTVKLHARQPISERELARFLDRFAELFLPTDGPTGDSLIQVEIHWHELRERLKDQFLEPPGEESAE